MNKKKIIKITALSLAALLVCGCLIFMGMKGFFTDPGNFMALARNKIMNFYHDITGTEPTVQEEFYPDENGNITLIDRPKGYKLALPGDVTVDHSISPELIRADREDMTIVISREWAPYEDPFYFIDNYLNNYYLNERYIEKNHIIIHENEVFDFKGAKAQFVSLTREDGAPEHLNNYSYFYVLSKVGAQAFFRIMIKTDSYEGNIQEVRKIIDSFEETGVLGQNTFKTDYQLTVPDYWNEETKALWKKINQKDTFEWGIFIDEAYENEEAYQWLTEIEEKVDYEFDFSLHYVNLSGEFPKEELQKFYEEGKITELTLQISNHANGDLFGDNPNFDVYDGKCDEIIRSFARGAKEFGHPFLFRLNNEMNSDWVNYSGVAALSDPDIFVANWRRIYEIFREEGVDNAIWIYNPNAEDCPPAHFNSYLAYYPGDEYVQMIGLTGYNTGTYYAEDYMEKWRTFEEIYQDPYDKYMERFGEFPFIITEFACSSVGGDKAAWITDMFSAIKKYKNIKMALWWSNADYDFRGEVPKLARPYWLDETEETVEAFKKGVAAYKKE
ncbi:MAG: hypothetical protein IJ043_00820 [Clostridia bacterium]|nr:hypothetical protein [Clostridia bacterium]